MSQYYVTRHVSTGHACVHVNVCCDVTSWRALPVLLCMLGKCIPAVSMMNMPVGEQQQRHDQRGPEVPAAYLRAPVAIAQGPAGQ